MKRSWKYNIKAIAEITGQTQRRVRDDRRKGVFNPDSLKDVARYIAKFAMVDDRSGGVVMFGVENATRLPTTGEPR